MKAAKRFPPTAWSLVARAGRRDADALSKLLSIYLPVMRSYLTYARRLSAQECDDVVQGFVERCLLRGSLLDRADRAKGRFRSLLVVALNHYLADRGRAAKASVSRYLQDVDVTHMPAPERPDRFDTMWARQVVRLVLEKAREDCVSAGQENYWALFELRVLRPALDDVEPQPYDTCLRTLGFSSVPMACNALVTVQRRLHRALREVVRDYALQSGIEDEISALREILTH